MTLRSRGLRPAIITALAVSIMTTIVSAGATNSSAAPAFGLKQWVGSWSAASSVPGPANPAPFAGFNDQSVRSIVRTSISGDSVRLRFANTFGDRHITIGHTTVALPNAATPERTDVDSATIREVTFGGSPTTLVPKGAEIVSDPIAMTVAALQELVVTSHLPTPTGPPTFHNVASAQTYVGAGDQAATAVGTGFTVVRTNIYFLTGVDVQTWKALGSIVVLGDSIVDGAFSQFNGYTRWSDRLAERLQAEKPLGPFELGVLNEGIGGNQLTHDGSEVGAAGSPGLGVNGLARLDRDIFGQAAVRAAFVCLGINDIQLSNDPAERVIAGLKQAALQVRERGLIAIGCTMTPFEGYVNWSPEKEATRQAVNTWLLGSNDFNGVMDFDAVMKDPAQPTKLKAEWDSGDHIHPNPAGYTAMGNAIPLRLFG
ncbi:lysophospholipase L1-like esterase [Allocatelliglobosispora scoriae]|uniref:Lysophospholipase L1-like esterase n=1 Tax=Allocatelliglobosispora scoriae TaxID=643052 RepID=A0A841C560_9ACTN|nr:SGNH/GDSL hydrolase family protein [Allocatelliglobosispora scoriae]MBB5874090.1 lysophospholipase L1-like esterase [Allocatelliglobosispora scoriae]